MSEIKTHTMFASGAEIQAIENPVGVWVHLRDHKNEVKALKAALEIAEEALLRIQRNSHRDTFDASTVAYEALAAISAMRAKAKEET